MAGYALGLTMPQTYRYVLLPMAFRLSLPPFGSECLNIVKNSAVALTIGLMELTASARAMSEFSYQTFEAFTAATIIYLLVNVTMLMLMRLLEKRVAVPGMSSARRNRARAREMLGDFDFDVIQRSWVYLFTTGMAFTLKLTALSMVGGIFLGTLLAIMRLSRSRIVSIAAGIM